MFCGRMVVAVVASEKLCNNMDLDESMAVVGG
jgi:hypothetical protein